MEFFGGNPICISTLTDSEIGTAIVTYQEGILVITNESTIPLASGVISSLYAVATLLDKELVKDFGYYQGLATTPPNFAASWLQAGMEVKSNCYVSIHFDKERDRWAVVYVCDPTDRREAYGVFLPDDDFEYLLEDCGHYITTVSATITDVYGWSIKGELTPSGATLSLSDEHIELRFPDSFVFTTTDQDKFLWLDIFDAFTALNEGRGVGSMRPVRSWGEERSITLLKEEGYINLRVIESLLGEPVLKGFYHVTHEELDQFEIVIRGYYAMKKTADDLTTELIEDALREIHSEDDDGETASA